MTQWPLGQAKARFSELVRLARAGEPQQVTVHSRDAVTVVATSEFERLASRAAAPSLHALLSSCPLGQRSRPGSVRRAARHTEPAQ